MMYRLKEGTFPPRFGIDPRFFLMFFVGSERNGTIDCWPLLGANSSLIRRSLLLGGELLVKE